MDKDLKNGEMEYVMMAIITKERNKDKANKDLQMDQHMKDNLKIIISTGKEFINGQMGKNTKESGKKI